MEKILQSKTFLVFGLLLICALFVITYKSVPFQQNEVYVQPTEVNEVQQYLELGNQVSPENVA